MTNEAVSIFVGQDRHGAPVYAVTEGNGLQQAQVADDCHDLDDAKRIAERLHPDIVDWEESSGGDFWAVRS